MRLYLDNNIYAFIQQRGDRSAFSELIRSRDLTVVGSDVNLVEAIRLTDSRERTERLRLLTSLVRIKTPPEPYLHANELLTEIERCRPAWLRPRPDTSRISVYLNLAKRKWSLAKSDPGGVAEGMEEFVASFEGGVGKLRASQKERRHLLRAVEDRSGQTQLGVRTSTGDRRLDYTPDNYWRTTSMAVWHAALFRRIPESRDYYDFAGPYLRPDIERDDWVRFWLDEIDADLMPRERLSALVEYYQAEHKVGHGNAADALHANHMLDCEVFLTTDRPLHAVLAKVENHYPGAGEPRLVDRAASNAVDAVEVALDSRA